VVEVEAKGDRWLEDVPGVEVVEHDGDGVLLELRHGADDQHVLDAARRAGRVRRFAPARPTLAELFREVVDR
jgi:ABC-2 type transport system ATP-binding protein